MAVGGAVQGGKFYGAYPELSMGGPDEDTHIDSTLDKLQGATSTVLDWAVSPVSAQETEEPFNEPGFRNPQPPADDQMLRVRSAPTTVLTLRLM